MDADDSYRTPTISSQSQDGALLPCAISSSATSKATNVQLDNPHAGPSTDPTDPTDPTAAAQRSTGNADLFASSQGKQPVLETYCQEARTPEKCSGHSGPANRPLVGADNKRGGIKLKTTASAAAGKMLRFQERADLRHSPLPQSPWRPSAVRVRCGLDNSSRRGGTAGGPGKKKGKKRTLFDRLYVTLMKLDHYLCID
ncbi:hypothetical protein THAOC_11010 [Thalassiosira oceanica]|uniref:Uncharacterized protein n=1 Tax=Thalassiosira oceanica TaxID=159749 RepID=K0T3D5_THAOC|nr:hypothetical protein THAOC_11010 [Thalassiosira oceanica]|eukprot:EJK67886.1 hypothetical protein THAOC_11010 [Thalassiosira oceanica]